MQHTTAITGGAHSFLHSTALTISTVLSLLLLPSTDMRPNTMTTKNTAPVAKFLRSASDSTSGTVCIVQSGQSRDGLSSSQTLTKHKCSHVNWRTGVGAAIAGLSWLQEPTCTENILSYHLKSSIQTVKPSC